MGSIFISYSSKDRHLVEALATEIQRQYGPDSVWWDQALESRAPYEPQIKAALEQARVVVVIWSVTSTTSKFVYSEAKHAAEDDKLVNVRAGDLSLRNIPMPFDQYHIDELTDTDDILRTIANVMTGVPIAIRVSPAGPYHPDYRQRLLDDKQVPLPRNPFPSHLLQAKYTVVAYDDSTGMRDRLLAWCLADSPPAGRLVHGPGGVGKTRLMIDVAKQLRETHGWQAGFLEPPPARQDLADRRTQALGQMEGSGDTRGRLLVIDYAEARQAEVCEVSKLLSQSTTQQAGPIRLVLLTRTAGEWWTMLINEDEALSWLFRDPHDEATVLEMPLLASSHQRLDYFAASLRALTPLMRALGYPPLVHEPPADRLQRIETGGHYVRPLAIQMEAMLWLASAAPHGGARGIHSLLDGVLGLERKHWEKLLGQFDDVRKRDLQRAVAQVTAIQGVDSPTAAERLLMADQFHGDRIARATVEPLVRDMAFLYGRPNGEIGPLEPDLIGEHHVAMTADVELIDGCLEWIKTRPAPQREQPQQTLLTVLQRATHPEHGEVLVARVTALLDHIIQDHGEMMGEAIVRVMRNTSGTLFRRLAAQVESLAEPALAAINFALPAEHLSWMQLSLRVAERYALLMRDRLTHTDVAALHPDEQDQLTRAATGMLALGLRLGNQGNHEAALNQSQSAVELLRRLVTARPDHVLPLLATGRQNLGIHLMAAGLSDAAIVEYQLAVLLYETLAESQPDRFLPDLARALNNLGGALSLLDRHDLALAACEKSTGIRRALAQDSPETFAPVLAASLNNLGAAQTGAGRHQAAIASLQEAVVMFRSLARDRPDEFRRHCSQSLLSLSNAFGAVGRYADVAEVAREGLAIVAPAVGLHPKGFWELARVLGAKYVDACERADREPDHALLERVSAAMAGLTADLAKQQGGLAKHERSLTDQRQRAQANSTDVTARRELAYGLFDTLYHAQSEGDLTRCDTLLDELRKLAQSYHTDTSVRHAFAMGLCDTATDAAARSNSGQCDSLLGELRRLAQSSLEDVRVRQVFAKAVFNTLARTISEGDSKRRDDLLNELRMLATVNPGDNTIRSRFAGGLFYLLTNAAAGHIRFHDALLNELRQLTRIRPAEPAVNRSLAKALFNSLNQAKADNDLTRRDALLLELGQLAHTEPTDAAVRQQLASALCNTLDQVRAEGDLARSDDLLVELRQLAQAYPTDKDISLSLAIGVLGTLYQAKATANRPRCEVLLGELRELAQSNLTDVPVRQLFAKGLFSLVNDAQKEGNHDRRAALLGELQRVAESAVRDPAACELFAKALVNTLYHAKREGNLAWRDTLLNELRRLAHSAPVDTAVRRQFANGLFITLTDTISEENLPRQNALLIELRQLVDTSPSDAAPRHALSMSLFNILNEAVRTNRELTRCDGLLDELRRLAQSVPADGTVREHFANGLFNTLTYAADEPTLARPDVLLAELRQLAASYPADSAVRQAVAMALFNVLDRAAVHRNLARRDELLMALRQLTQAYPTDATVRQRFANGLFNTIRAATLDNALATSGALLVELGQLAKTDSADSAIRKLFADAQIGVASTHQTMPAVGRSTLTPARTDEHATLRSEMSARYAKADPERAARLNIEYQRQLHQWRDLPFWRRLMTKAPKPPTGI